MISFPYKIAGFTQPRLCWSWNTFLFFSIFFKFKGIRYKMASKFKNQQTVKGTKRDQTSVGYVTNTSRSLLVKSINLGHKLIMHPYEWNAKLKRCERTTSKTRIFTWRLNAFVMLCYWDFVAFRFVQTASNENSSTQQSILCFFAFTFFLFPVFLHLTFHLQGSEIPGFINHCMKMLQGKEPRGVFSY